MLLAFASLIAVQLAIGRFLYAGGFNEAEQRDLLARARHAQAVLGQGFSHIAPGATDYADWDATNDFLLSRSPQYAEYNWHVETLRRFHADLVFIVDLEGRIALGRGLHPDGRELVEPDAAEARTVQRGGTIWARLAGNATTEGYVAIGSTPYQWAAAPVRPTGSTVAPSGWLVLLKRLDREFVAELDRTLDSHTGFKVVATSQAMTSKVALPLRADELRLLPESRDTVTASFVVAPLGDGSMLELTLGTTRHFTSALARISGHMAWISLAAGTLIAAVAMLWVRRRLTGPLGQISGRLQAIAAATDLSARLPPIGRGDEITGVVITCNQMLEQIEAKRDAERARDAALEASRSKSEFLARMSHEIRTPMNGVLGMTELLSATRLDDRQRRFAQTIHQSAESLLGIINDVLDFSKIEAGRMALDVAAFDLREVVEDAAEMLGDRAAGKGLELVCDLPPGMKTAVRGDGARLRQVLVNLLSNAVKFTEQGQVTLRLRETGGTAAVAQLRFEVEDTGIGIRAENQARIFESFAQEDGTTTRRYGGTGLGLAISRQLLRLMGGELEVRSKAGSGSTFFFKLALPREPTTDEVLQPARLTNARVLVVDDNATNREILAAQLGSWGMEVAVASSGAQALEVLRRQAADPVDVVLLDMKMPGMDGLAVSRAARAAPGLQDVAIVMLSSVAATIAKDDWHQAGVTAWLTKPVRQAQLQAVLAKVLAVRRAGQSGSTQALPVLRGDCAVAGRNVLLIEDNPVNQEVARGMLASLGATVVSAWNGQAGLATLQEQRFDVVLMDCHMPELDGYETTRRLREWEAQHQHERTPILALTANAMQGDRQKCLEAGMDSYLSKPFTVDQLRAELGELLRAGATAAEASPTVPASAITKPAASPPAAAPQRPSATNADTEPLDSRALAAIRDMQQPGAPDLLQKIIALYLENSQQLVAALGGALTTGDARAVGQAAHALRSSSANVGAGAVAEVCRALEAAGHGGDLATAAGLEQQLLREYARATAALRAEQQRSAA